MRKILFPLALALFGMMFVLWILSKTNIIHETPSWWTAYIFIAVTLMAVLIKSSAESPSTMMSETAKESALDVLEKHNLHAHYYLAGIGLHEDRELANACNRMAAAGYIITDSAGELVGKVATARLTPAELAQERRASFRLVKSEE